MDESISFEVANRAVSHLGRHLYGSTPPALAELVANSYDAYATKVDIVHVQSDSASDELVYVADNGVGMNLAQLRNNYAKIGQFKQPTNVPEGMNAREPMGKKGIGKLAAFSIGDVYTVYTKTNDDEKWRKFSLEYSELIESERYLAKSEEVELPDYLSKYVDYKSGCIVVIQAIRRKWISTTDLGLESRLSRRFYLLSTDNDFSLMLNGKILDLSANDYYGNLESLVCFGYSEADMVRIFGDDLAGKVSYFDESTFFDVGAKTFNYIVNEKGAKGWIGFVEHPKDLHKNSDENFQNIVVYINGKIADDDLLRNYPDSTFASKYLVGEIIADYLSFANPGEDVVTSSRQGLDNDDPEVEQLIDFSRMIRARAISIWNSLRKKESVKKLPSYITEDAAYKDWLKNLDAEATSLNNGIVRCVQALIDGGFADKGETEDSVKALVNGSIEMVELVNKANLSKEVVDLSTENNLNEAFSKMLALLADINASEAYSLYKISKEKVDALEKLSDLLNASNAKEVEFQDLLIKNPWLINPEWKPLDPSEDEATFSARKEAFYRVRDSFGNEARSRIDILITMREHNKELCAIVELKRDKITGYSKVEYTDIYNQIKKYREAIIKADPNRFCPNSSGKEIPAFFLFSSDSGLTGMNASIGIQEYEIALLKDSNITVIPYDTLLSNCKRMLSEERNILKRATSRPFFYPTDDAE